MSYDVFIGGFGMVSSGIPGDQASIICVLDFLNQNTQEVKHERFLITTRQNNVRIFGTALSLTKRQTDKQILKHEKK